MKFKLAHVAMNMEHAAVFDLVIKLAYEFSPAGQPRLEIFENDEEAAEGEWAVYGADAGAGPGRVVSLVFRSTGETHEFKMNESRYRIGFISQGEREVNYPRGGPKVEPVYEFGIEKIG